MGKYADSLPKSHSIVTKGRAAEIRKSVIDVLSPDPPLSKSQQEEAFKSGERLFMRPRSEDKVPSDRIKELFGNLKGTNDEDVHGRSRDEHDADFGDLGS